MAKKPLGENPRKVLAVLKEAGANVEFTSKQMQEACGFEKAGNVTGSVTALVNRGAAERAKKIGDDGKEISVFYLTEAGVDYDPDTEVLD